jgi:hypothetical protein
MKLKGIKPIEQHFEKLIVVVLAAMFMLVLAMQFVVQPNKIEVGKPRAEVRPGSAYTPIEKRASRLLAEMTRPDPALPEVKTVDIASDFRQSLTGGVAPREVLALGIPGRRIEGGENIDIGRIAQSSGMKYAPLVPPAPTKLVVGSVLNTLSPLDVQNIEGLADFMPAQQPFDKNVVTVEGVVDGTAIRALLSDDADVTDDVIPFRRNWWRNKVQILSVRLEREELTETGEWTNLQVVPTLPGSISVIEDIDDNVRSTSALEALAASAAKKRVKDLVLQPPYYRAMAGQEWKPPVDLAEDLANNVDQVKIDEFTSRLARAEKKLEDIIALKAEREAATGVTMASFDRRIKQREKEVDDLKDELRSMGQVFEDDPAEALNVMQIGEEETETPLLDDPAVRIWAHDLTAEPGATYRYRLGIVVNNPAFGRVAAMHDEQKDLAEQPLVYGEMSEWTDPVEVDQMEYFFVTSASSGGQGALASGAKATVDVFRFYYGFWRRGSTGLKPGDVIVADVSNPDDLYLFDLEAAPKDPNSGKVLPAALEPPELDEDGNPIDPPEWLVPVETRITAPVEAQFLDVSRIPGEASGGIAGASTRPKYQAIFEGGHFAQLFVRNPAVDKASQRYQRMVRSAKLGETQGQPVAKEQGPQGLPGSEPGRPGGDPELPPEEVGGGGGG